MSAIVKNTNRGQFQLVLSLVAVAVLVPAATIATVAIIVGTNGMNTAPPEWLLWLITISFSIVGIGISVGFGALGIAFTMKVLASVDEIEFLKEKDRKRNRSLKDLSDKFEIFEKAKAKDIVSEAGEEEL